jgi:hypothetical protein
MTVLESAVSTGLNFGASSARTAEAMLTAPTAARPNVHLLILNFICSSDVVWFLFYCLSGVKTVYPKHPAGAIDFKRREIQTS